MKMHLSLPVLDLEASERFYAALLGAPPVKVRPGFLKYDPDTVALNLTLREVSRLPAIRPHLGFEMPDASSLERVAARLCEAVWAFEAPAEALCCHGRQTKFVTSDPSGHEWEVYTLEGDEPHIAADPVPATPCCRTGADCCPGPE